MTINNTNIRFSSYPVSNLTFSRTFSEMCLCRNMQNLSSSNNFTAFLIVVVIIVFTILFGYQLLNIQFRVNNT